MAIGHNIRKARENKGFTRKDLAGLILESDKKIENIETGKQKVTVDIIIACSQYLGVTLDYLATGKESSPATTNDKLSIPYYGNVPVSAGGGAVILSEEPTEIIEVPRRLAKRILTTEKPMTFPVTGDSMEPSFKNGDVVVAGVSPDYPCDGVYVIRYEETMYIKRLMKSKDGYLLISDNKLYNDITVTKSDDFAIIGRVIQVLHNV